MNDDQPSDNGSTAEEDDEKALVSADDSHGTKGPTTESDISGKSIVSGSTNSVAQAHYDIFPHLLGLVLATSALAAASGNLVVNSFLDKYGFFTNLSISPTVYIGAGITLWLYLILALFVSRIPLHLLDNVSSRWGEPLMMTILMRLMKFKRFSNFIMNFNVQQNQKFYVSVFRYIFALFGSILMMHDYDEPEIRTVRRYFLLLANLFIWSALSSSIDDVRYLFGQVTVDAFVNVLYTVAAIQIFANIAINIVFKVIKINVGIVEYAGIIWVFTMVVFQVTNYGANLYGYIHKGFGGGAPSKIHIHTNYLVANEDYVGVKVLDSGITETVCLLVESFDGLVIYNPRTRLSSMFDTGPQTPYIGHSTSLDSVDCSPPKLRGLGPLYISEKDAREQNLHPR